MGAEVSSSKQGRRIASSLVFVNVFPVFDDDNSHDKMIMVDSVDYSAVTDANPSMAFKAVTKWLS